MKRVLVTGAGGLLGGALTRALAGTGFDVLATGRRPMPSEFQYRPAELADSGAVASLFDGGQDVVVHAAARIRGTESDAAAYARDNVLATANLAEAAVRAGVRFFILASTISVYAGEGPFAENARADAPGAYGASKRAAECLCLAALGNGAVVLRFGGLHGAPRRSGALRAFADQAAAGREISVGEPDTIFSPTFIDDAIAAVLLLLRSGPPPSQIYNLAVAETPTYREVAEGLRALVGGSGSVASPAAPRRRNRALDVSRIRRELGFVPGALDVHLKKLAESALAAAP